MGDWHFVPQNDFAADLRDQSDTPISDDEIDAFYSEYLGEVRRVQAEQREVLRWLIMHCSVRQVFCEGLTDSDLLVYELIIRQLRLSELDLNDLVDADSPYDATALRIGAAGQLIVAGELAEILPAEDEAAYERADPLAGDRAGPVFDDAANEEREAGIVRKLLAAGPLAVVVLGGAHDLSDQVRRQGGGKCQYIQVMVNGYPAP
jgi:hypothetical protein